MISEKSRNLSASCAASWANQMFLNVVLRRTARKPPGLSTSNLNGSALNGSAIAGRILTGKSEIQRFPLVQAQGLGTPFRVDSRISQPCPRLFAADSRNPAQRSAQLL